MRVGCVPVCGSLCCTCCSACEHTAPRPGDHPGRGRRFWGGGVLGCRQPNTPRAFGPPTCVSI
eukprot:4427334-Prymnesium_polylepis.1